MSTIVKPRFVKVACSFLAYPCLDKDEAMSTRRLRSMFTVINCAQQIVAADPLWKRDKDAAMTRWRARPCVSYTLQVKRLADWCQIKPDALTASLDRFTKPMGGWPAPVVKYKVFENSMYGRQVSVTVSMEWAHLQERFVQVDLVEFPVGSRATCREFLASLIPPDVKIKRRQGPQSPPTKPGSFWD